MKKIRISGIIATLFFSIIITGCFPGGYVSIGGSTNNCEVYGNIDFSVKSTATNDGFYVCFSETVNTPDIISNYDYAVLGQTTNLGTLQPYSIHIPEGNYYVYAWIDDDESSSDTNSGSITSGDLEKWYENFLGQPRTLSIPDGGDMQFNITMEVIP